MKQGGDLYIDLLKQALSFQLWPEPPMPVDYFAGRQRTLLRRVLRRLSGFLSRWGFMIAETRLVTNEERIGGEYWPGYADTMIGVKRLDNIEHCVRSVLSENIPGNLIETGVWRGGSCIFMRGLLEALGDRERRVFVADSFEGLPAPDLDRYPQDAGDTLHQYDVLAVSEGEVRRNFERYGLLDDRVVFLKGFFADTLPTADTGPLAILRLDGDMYASTMDVLDALYDKLVPGGYCIIDDYGLSTCEKAVTDFRARHSISDPLEIIDRFGVFWRKS
jgi:O-methyltransferase